MSRPSPIACFIHRDARLMPARCRAAVVLSGVGNGPNLLSVQDSYSYTLFVWGAVTKDALFLRRKSRTLAELRMKQFQGGRK